MNWFVIVAGAFGVGLLAALFGALKDTLWEGFSLAKFFRSPIVVTICTIIWLFLSSPSSFVELLILWFAAFGLERLATEFYKAIIRREKPSKFSRPQRDTGWLRERFLQLWQYARHRAS